MTLLTLAVKNVRHQFRSYAAYFLSSSFAVWLFFLYGSLLFHPDFAEGKIPPFVRSMMLTMEGLVALFSVLFILYAHSAFLRNRQKELALLTTLGMLPRQITGVIWRENMLIGLGAIVTGVLTGVVTARLFFLGIGRILDIPHPVPFHFSTEAAAISVIGFGLLFMAVSLLSLRSIRRLSIAEVLRESVRPKAPPKFSPWLAAVALVTLGAAYTLGLTAADREAVGDRINWILLLGLVGTYFLFTQGSVLILRLLQRRRSLYWRGSNLITLSQLAFKLKDNARILFMITLMSTFVLSLVSLLYSAYAASEDTALRLHPVNLQQIGTPGGMTPERTEEALRQQGVAIKAHHKLPALRSAIHFTRDGRLTLASTLLVPVSGYNQWVTGLTGAEPIDLKEGHVAVVMTDSYGSVDQTAPVALYFLDVQKWNPTAGEPLVPERELALQQIGVVKAFNMTGETYMVAVVTDTLFADLAAQHGAQWGRELDGWAFTDWKASTTALVALEDQIRQQDPAYLGRGSAPLSATALQFRENRQGFAFMFFLLGFVSVLFFLASGNMLYFKLFTDLQADRKQFQALYKLGVGTEEVRQVVSIQTLLLFFVPFLVALVHTMMITATVRVALMEMELWRPLGLVTAIYLMLYGAYWLVTRRTYTQAVLER